MPQIKIRGIGAEKIRSISKELVDELTQIVGCPRDYFTIECIETTSIFDGEVVETYPFIEVVWFDREQDIQDKVAKTLTKYVNQLGVKDLDIAFTLFQKNRYYENGEHF
ncbi:DUF1904 domain-containing protein [Paramaledivibacter caminithermalis]|uniref:DUF1904 domain-containing protein n=1 Tax=Paramaledivibacter caminithermalis (strain DSM 15212 / CIP 107654 / DViRD3) TaxID=1121301 RepID=A0A1M6M0M4_PARC5|nr:DUF1904 domain-containing protein [Paramaledivibacter caminithermalis]SHJ77042.1 protein of unknown function [Paramaledivibacter caminithermalis DSM 15212]